MRSLDDAGTLALFVRNLREGVYITNASGRILDGNAAFLEMFGAGSLDDLRERTAASLLADPATRVEDMRLLSTQGAVREFELDIVRLDGTVLTVLDTAYAVEDPATGETLYHGILVDITGRKRIERELREMAMRDPLTGCRNRRYLDDLVSRLEASGASWGVIVVDVDHFKDYNDRYGHDLGDRLLVQIGQFLSRQVRADDPVIRIGGDEFAVVLPRLDRDTTGLVASRIKKAGPSSAPVSFTLGWSAREGGERFDETLRRADRQLIQVRVEERQPRPLARID